MGRVEVVRILTTTKGRDGYVSRAHWKWTAGDEDARMDWLHGTSPRCLAVALLLSASLALTMDRAEQIFLLKICVVPESLAGTQVVKLSDR